MSLFVKEKKSSKGQIKVNLTAEMSRLEALFSLAPGSRWQRPAGSAQRGEQDPLAAVPHGHATLVRSPPD